MTEKTIARRLREYADGDDGGGDSFCREIAGEDYWDDFGMRNTARRIAEEVEAEQNALMMELCGPYTSVWRGMNAYAESVGMPMGYEESITSWLDRWFVPRLKFEDGKPVQFGDRCEYDGSRFAARKLVCYADGLTTVCDKSGNGHTYAPGERVRRHVCKALDADGEEVKAGDVVYRIGEARRLEVADPHAMDDCGDPVVECVVLDDGRGAGDYPDADVVACKASELTHERPVLDADGVSMGEGDTVWDIKSGNKFNVQCLDPFKVVGFGGISSTWFRPEEFTHREPDSLEKLLDDLDAFMRDCSINADKVDEFCDRLTALMERGV